MLKSLVRGSMLAALLVLVGGAGAVLQAVEGAGAYRGSGVILPHYTNTGNVRTFFRFINAFDRREEAFVASDGEPDQRTIFVHITYLRAVAGSGSSDVCEEQDFFFFMTKNDYKLLDVFGDPQAGAPSGFQEGYAVAWATHADLLPDGSRIEGDKIYHNHLAADEVTVDLVNGQAWGTNATTFRAQVELNCGPACNSNPDAGGEEETWFASQSDGEEFAVLGICDSDDDSNCGDNNGQQYENLRFPERFFPTVMSDRTNIQGATSAGTRYLVVPLSFVTEGVLGAGRTVLVPSALPIDQAYVNRYTFDVRVFKHNEERISAPNRTVICYDDLTASEISAGVVSDPIFRGPNSIEQWQGWIDIEGKNFGTVPILAQSGSWDYYNRALVVQVDQIGFGRNVQWGFYPAHDRTTAELNPDPDTYNAHGVGAGSAVDPDSTPVYF